MKFKEVAKSSEKSLFVIFSPGDEVVAKLLDFASKQKLISCRFQAIGAFERAVLAFYDLGAKVYKKIAVDEQVEVVSLSGNITVFDGKPKIHAHAVISFPDGRAMGGHLVEGHVRPTLEMTLDHYASVIERKMNEEAGIPLISLS